MATAKYIIVLALALLLLPAITPASGTAYAWKQISVSAKYVVAYDIDGDSEEEIIALPDTLIDNGVAVQLPLPRIYDWAAVADIDGDGREELILYSSGSGILTVYRGETPILNTTAPPGVTPVVSSGSPYKVISVGDKLVWIHGETTLHNVSSTVIPFFDGIRPWGIYVDTSGRLVMSDGEETKILYPDSLTPRAAVYDIFNRTLYVLTTSPNGTVLIKYCTGNNTRVIIGYDIHTDSVAYASPSKKFFIVNTPVGVYLVDEREALLLSSGEAVASNGPYIFIAVGDKLVKYSVNSLSPVQEYPLVKAGNYSASNTYVIAWSSRSIYVLVEYTPPSIYIHLSTYTPYAFEPVYYRINAYGEDIRGETLLVDGAAYPPEGAIVFNKTGEHVLEAYVDTPYGSYIKKIRITVLPRPMEISIHVSNPAPEPYTPLSLKIYARDSLNGTYIDAACNIAVGGIKLAAHTGEEINITTPLPENNKLEITAVCTAPGYKEETYTLPLTVQPLRPRLNITYLGKGVVEITPVIPSTREPLTGKLDITIGGTGKHIEAEAPATITLPKPGEYMLEIDYVPDKPYVEQAHYVVDLKYYFNVSEIPGNMTKYIVGIADRIINNTVIKYVNRTVEEPVEVPVVKKVEAPMNPVVAAASFTAGLGAGLLTSLVFARLRRRKEDEDLT